MTPKERPILLSERMVLSTLSLRKNQTRRAVKGNPNTLRRDPTSINGRGGWIDEYGQIYTCPYGHPGDRLYVREATLKIEDNGWLGPVYVASEEADEAFQFGYGAPDDPDFIEPYDLKIRPSIHMPRRYARIFLEIEEVRVEKLQDISEEDAKAEGAPIADIVSGHALLDQTSNMGTYRWGFELLWDNLYINKSCAWRFNPWVFAIKYRII